jgi:hypothetical protein
MNAADNSVHYIMEYTVSNICLGRRIHSENFTKIRLLTSRHLSDQSRLKDFH